MEGSNWCFRCFRPTSELTEDHVVGRMGITIDMAFTHDLSWVQAKHAIGICTHVAVHDLLEGHMVNKSGTP